MCGEYSTELEVYRKLSQLRSKLTSPTWWRRRIHTRINHPVQKLLYDPDTAVPELDWDTLVVLDACPAWLFESVIGTKKWHSYEMRLSGAGNTYNWLRRHWTDEYGDTIYISGNPMVSRHVPGAFHDLIEAWRDAINESLGAPSPSTVTEAGIDAHDSYPNKRIVVHYLQPHYPFVQRPDLQFTDFAGTDEWEVEGDPRASDVWEALRKGIVTESEVRSGYRSNLNYVAGEVERLLSEIEGKVVVTSDHGNLFGKYTFPVPIKEFGHSSGLPQPSLATVPWAVREGNRRRITEGGSHSSSEASADEIASHLEALGYK